MSFGDRFLEIFSTVVFFIAVAHLFFSDQFLKLAHRIRYKSKGRFTKKFSYFGCSFLGNAALIFGLWLVPILIVMVVRLGGSPVLNFVESIDLKEPFAYFTLITVAMVRPLRNLFDALMLKMNEFFKHRILYFWAGTILFSSLLTGFFSEISIMTLVCLYLSETFFSLKPSARLSYFTFSLLLLSLAVGKTVIPVNLSFFMELLNGDWSRLTLFYLFGWKVLLGLIGLLLAVGYLFKKEFSNLQKLFAKNHYKPHEIRFRELVYAALFLTASIGKHNAYLLLMVVAIVIILHKYPYRIKKEEGKLKLYFPLLIAFFTYTLEMHAGLQKWWVLPLFERAQGIVSYSYAFLLTGLNEHVPLQALQVTFQTASESTQFFSYLGVLTGGGLTIIAKSANIVSKLTLRKHFPHHVVSPFLQFMVAIPLALLLFAWVTLLTYLW